jgi:hypothetical protein
VSVEEKTSSNSYLEEEEDGKTFGQSKEGI